MTPASLHPGHRSRQGFTVVAMLFILVVLAALGAAIATLSQRQHQGFASELAASRAYQAAFAGLEWGSLQMLQASGGPACFATTTLSFGGSTPALADFTVTVSCTRTPSSGTVADGSNSYVFYQLTANACNSPLNGACPPPTTSTPPTGYVERQLTRNLSRCAATSTTSSASAFAC